MRILFTLLQKEFKQIFRNKLMLPIIFVIPVVQMILLTYAASMEMKGITMAVVDQDFSQASRQLVSHFEGSPFFEIELKTNNYQEAEDELTGDHVVVNAINATEAGLINAYCTQIITSFNSKIRSEWFDVDGRGRQVAFEITPSYWYNPLLDFKIYMFSGILVIIVTLIGMLLTALNLVREKEMGTTEQINVTPVRKYQFIMAKLLPFMVIALFELTFGLIIGRLLFGLPIVGSLGLLFLFTVIYLFVVLGFGLFLSTISSTQQQLMYLAFFFMLTFILMSGVFTPADSMPAWAQKINLFNPVAYFMRVIRMILLKGSGFSDISREFYSLCLYAVLILSLAITNYRKTT